LKTILSDLVG